MRASILFLSLLPVVNSSPIRVSSARSRGLEIHRRDGSHWPHVPRLILYVQNQANVDGSPLSLLPLLEEHTRVTHIIVSSFHVNRVPDPITLNDDPPDSPKYDNLWHETAILQSYGVKVMAMIGGAAGGTYYPYGLGTKNETEFEGYYSSLVSILRRYKFDGLDIDIEEFIDQWIPLRLLNRLRVDMGPNFIMTLAPTASALINNNGINLSGFNYFDLDSNATSPSGSPLINWYNTQFYSGFGSPETPETYQKIMAKGWDPARVVMGVLDNTNDGNGFVPTATVVDTVRKLRGQYPTFGGVCGWDYFDAGMGWYDGVGDSQATQPWQWVIRIRDALEHPWV